MFTRELSKDYLKKIKGEGFLVINHDEVDFHPEKQTDILLEFLPFVPEEVHVYNSVFEKDCTISGNRIYKTFLSPLTRGELQRYCEENIFSISLRWRDESRDSWENCPLYKMDFPLDDQKIYEVWARGEKIGEISQ